MMQILLIAFLFLSSCATMKSWFFSEETKKNSSLSSSTVTSASADSVEEENSDETVRFSDNNQVLPLSDRQYKKMTRSRMEEESQLNAQAGSLWMMEGQTSYLFAQNKSRREGDATTIKLEGSNYKFVESKAISAQKLLKKLDDRLKAQEEAEALAQKAAAEAEKARQPASEGEKSPAAAPVAATAPAAPKAEKEVLPKLDLSDLERIPVRIVERTEQGYRVRGAQSVMISDREYKVITTGIIRPEDFTDESVSSNKMLDPQFDLVSVEGMKEGRSRE